MSRYNHFVNRKYHRVCFGALGVGDKFRMNKWKGKRRRTDIIMIKTGDRSYQELKSKKEYTVITSAFDVSSFSNLISNHL